MALIVEDGSGVAGAESYVQVADADTYFLNRTDTVWVNTVSNANKESALRQAVDFMQQVYRGRWKGYRTRSLQALDWPRQSVLIEDSVLNAWVPNNSIPDETKRAQMELAKRVVASGPLAPDIPRLIARASVGDISVDYEHGSVPYVTYRAVDGILRPFLRYFGPMVEVVRA